MSDEPNWRELADIARKRAEAAEAERDRFRAALAMIATPPVHVPGVSEGCEGCAGVAHAALHGTDFAGPISTTLKDVDAVAERDRLQAAVAEAAQTLVEELDANPIGEYGDAVCEAIDVLDAKLKAAKEGT